MTQSPDPSRRDFLTGKAAQQRIRAVGDEIADSLLETSETPTPEGGETVRLETRAMGCPWSVIMNPGPSRQVMVATDAFDVVRAAEQMLTIYREDSEVSVLNKQAFGESRPISSELFEFLKTCQRLFEETNGAFDPASGRLIQLWKDARDHGRIPTENEVETVLAQSGLSHFTFEESETSVRFNRPLMLDFASIGKGYGIDLAAEHLKSEQLDSFLIHGGQSSLIAYGEHNSHSGWPVGLKNPLFTDKRYATIVLHNQAMSTSGSNIQYFRHSGQRYGHLLDPRTGWPAEGLLSVTVITPSATDADALSTALYVMGLDNALEYCDDHPEVGAILVPQPRGRLLEPQLKNLDAERIYFELDESIEIRQHKQN